MNRNESFEAKKTKVIKI